MKDSKGGSARAAHNFGFLVGFSLFYLNYSSPQWAAHNLGFLAEVSSIYFTLCCPRSGLRTIWDFLRGFLVLILI